MGSYYYQHPHILKIGGCPNHVHWLSVEVGVGQTMDIWLGQDAYKYLSFKWPRSQISCSNFVIIEPNNN